MSDSDSSSSDEDSEEQKKLKSAIDPNFVIKRDVTTNNTQISKSNGKNGTDKIDKMNPKKSRKSVREIIMKNEEDFPKPYSLDVTPETQNFIAKKLSTALEKLIDEAPSNLDTSPAEEQEGIFLFSSSNVQINSMEKDKSELKKRKKPKLRRKRHIDGSESDEEEAKIRAVAVSAEWVKENKLY